VKTSSYELWKKYVDVALKILPQNITPNQTKPQLVRCSTNKVT
ncbi:uncharacterized protein METZ01_LOCUS496135, partial [marine metagenome]